METLAVYNASAIAPADNVKLATDVAGICKEIVTRTAQNIQGRRYVRVEGWQAIATAHGCIASARDVERVETGWRCIGEIRRMDTGAVISTAEGFVGDDEPVWCGGTVKGKTYEARPEYAKRAMCQTRAISRACRSAFAHVVVMMNEGLETTPAEEVPHDGFTDAKPVQQVHDDLCSEAMIKRLYAIGKAAGTKWEEIPAMLCAKFPYLKTGAETHLSLLKRADYAEAEKVVKGETIPMNSAPAAPTPAAENAPLPLPKGVKEFWPETEFGNDVEVIFSPIANVREPAMGKSGKPGPWKVILMRDEKELIADTFDKTLAALAQAMGAGGETRECAIQTTVNGKWTNVKLCGLR